MTKRGNRPVDGGAVGLNAQVTGPQVTKRGNRPVDGGAVGLNVQVTGPQVTKRGNRRPVDGGSVGLNIQITGPRVTSATWQLTSLKIGVTAAEEDILSRIDSGALLTVYVDGSNWADYAINGAISFDGAGATRTATIPLTWREGVGTPPVGGTIEIHLTPDGADGIAYRDIVVYRVIALSANLPAFPASPTWASATQTLGGITGWSTSFPAYDPNTHKVACAIILVGSDDSALPLGSVRQCESPGDINAVFVRSESQPARLADSATRLPPDTYDTSGNVPAGDGFLWVAFGTRAPSGTVWTWSTWEKLTGEDGLPGTRGLASYTHSRAWSTRATTSTVVDADGEWHLSGSLSGWAGQRTLTVALPVGREGNKTYADLQHVLVAGLVTIYRDADNWGDYVLRDAIGSDRTQGNGDARAAVLALDPVEGEGTPDGSAIELHYSPAGRQGLSAVGHRYAVRLNDDSSDSINDTGDIRFLDGSTILHPVRGREARDVTSIQLGIDEGDNPLRRVLQGTVVGDKGIIYDTPGTYRDGTATGPRWAEYDITAISSVSATTRTATLTVDFAERSDDMFATGVAEFGLTKSDETAISSEPFSVS